MMEDLGSILFQVRSHYLASSFQASTVSYSGVLSRQRSSNGTSPKGPGTSAKYPQANIFGCNCSAGAWPPSPKIGSEPQTLNKNLHQASYEP